MIKINRPQVTQEILEETFDNVKKRLSKKIKKKGWGAMVSSHEMLGIIDEEFDEFKVSVQQNDDKGVEEELNDVALSSIWALASCKVLKND